MKTLNIALIKLLLTYTLCISIIVIIPHPNLLGNSSDLYYIIYLISLLVLSIYTFDKKKVPAPQFTRNVLKILRSKIFIFLFICIILLYLVINFKILGGKALWDDELYQLMPLLNSKISLASEAAKQQQPPGSYIQSLFANIVFGHSHFSYRIHSLAFGILTCLYLFTSLSLYTKNKFLAFTSSIFLLLIPIFINYSNEGRPYSYAHFITLLIFVHLKEYYDNPQEVNSYSLTPLFFLYLNTVGLSPIIVLGSFFFFFLYKGKLSNRYKYFHFSFLISLIFFLPTFYNQVISSPKDLGFINPFPAFSLIQNDIKNLYLSITYFEPRFFLYYTKFSLSLIILSAFLYCTKKYKDLKSYDLFIRNSSFLYILIFILFILLYLYYYWINWTFYSRYILILLAPYILVTGLLLNSLPATKSLKKLIGLFSLFFIFYQLYAFDSKMLTEEPAIVDYRGIFQTLNKQTKNTTAIIFPTCKVGFYCHYSAWYEKVYPIKSNHRIYTKTNYKIGKHPFYSKDITDFPEDNPSGHLSNILFIIERRHLSIDTAPFIKKLKSQNISFINYSTPDLFQIMFKANSTPRKQVTNLLEVLISDSNSSEWTFLSRETLIQEYLNSNKIEDAKRQIKLIRNLKYRNLLSPSIQRDDFSKNIADRIAHWEEQLSLKE